MYLAVLELFFLPPILSPLGRWVGKSLDPQTPEEKEEETKGFANNGFNQFRSDRISLDREIPDTRDPRQDHTHNETTPTIYLGINVC